MMSLRACVLTFALFCVSPVMAQLEMLDPRYELSHVLPNPPDVEASVCDVLFTADGSQIYLTDDCEDAEGSVYLADITRDSSGKVTAIGTPALLATLVDNYFDAGIVLTPDGATLLFYLYDYGFGQLVLGESSIDESAEITGYDTDYGGLDMLPTGPFAGDLVHSETVDALVYRHALTNNGDGTYGIETDGVVWADLSGLVDTNESDLGDIDFVQRGPLAGHAVLTAYNGGPTNRNNLFLLPISETGSPDPASGKALLRGLGGAWGVEQDPITGDIWVADYSEAEFVIFSETGLDENGNRIAVPIPSLGMAGLLLLAGSLLLLALVRRRAF